MAQTQTRYIGGQLDPHAVEEKIAFELQRRKVEEEQRRRVVERICAGSDEIKSLNAKIQMAYVNKERTQQIAEVQMRRMNDLHQECEIDASLLKKREKEIFEERERDQRKFNQRLVGKQVLQRQMMDKQIIQQEAQQQYIAEKDQVDAILSKIIQDDRNSFEVQQKKKQQSMLDMKKTLREKEISLQNEKARLVEENEKYLQFIRSKDKQAVEIKQKKLDSDAARDKIFQKLKEEEERRRREEEVLTDLRFELYREQYDAQAREKERQQLIKRESAKRDMMEAEREAKLKKQKDREEEQQLEKDFRDYMMKKFHDDDQLEKMNQSKRRQREVEHRNQIESLWQEKLKQFQQQKEDEREEIRRKQEEEKFKEQIIREERDRILREHLQYVGEFLPKGLVQTQSESWQANTSSQMPRSNYNKTFRIGSQ